MRSLPFHREKGDFGQIYWECECGAVAEEPSKFEHETGCVCTADQRIPSGPLEELVERVLNHISLKKDEVEFFSEIDYRELKGIRWQRSGSTSRTVLGFGRTYGGDFLLPGSHKGVVMKVDPNVRYGRVGRSGNIDELSTYEKAIETGTEGMFADILSNAVDGMWLLMEEAIPIYPRHREEMSEFDAIWDRGRDTYIDPLRSALREGGWESPDWKHGNIGLCDDEVPRLIDYGTGPDRINS